MLLALGLPLKGQVTDNLRNSYSDSVQTETLREIPDEIVMLNILNLHSQIINNMTKMMGILYVEQKILEAKIDSILSFMNKDISKRQAPPKKIPSIEKLQNLDTDFPLKKHNNQ